ncbi:MAG: molybdenum cofactor biosynthesis protein MoaE [Acidimicrobiia bacterium]|nr:molybdenum cofactor biosynthesis protein MoaE [Acidimicrobiia bacterium]
MRLVPPRTDDDWVGLTAEPLPVGRAVAWAERADCGAVVLFTGTVRDHAPGRLGVTALEYEAYEEEVCPRLAAIVAEARRRWPALGRVAALHRVGAVDVGETSVLVTVSAPHRAEAFDAARFCIDTLKATVPIWKRETWAGGSDWALCSHPVEDVESVEAVEDVESVEGVAPVNGVEPFEVAPS